MWRVITGFITIIMIVVSCVLHPIFTAWVIGSLSFGGIVSEWKTDLVDKYGVDEISAICCVIMFFVGLALTKWIGEDGWIIAVGAFFLFFVVIF